MSTGEYLYPNDHTQALARLRALEAIEDPGTIAALANAGVVPGSACLELGAGAGSIAYWLAQRVGGDGRVVAADVDPRWLDSSRCEVWRHDLRTDPLPAATFDLAHMRNTLIHIAQEEHASIIAKLLSTLKPGGVLVLEESDLSTWAASPETPEPLRSRYAEGVAAVLRVYVARGLDLHLGRRLPDLVAHAGFRIEGSDERSRTVMGGSAEAEFHRMSFAQLAAVLEREAAPMATQIHAFLDAFADHRLIYRTRTTVAIRAARRPSPSAP